MQEPAGVSETKDPIVSVRQSLSTLNQTYDRILWINLRYVIITNNTALNWKHYLVGCSEPASSLPICHALHVILSQIHQNFGGGSTPGIRRVRTPSLHQVKREALSKPVAKSRRAPHELDAAKQQREDEKEEEQKKRNAQQAATKAAAEDSLVLYETLPDQGNLSILGTTVESQLSQEISQLSLENFATIESSFDTGSTNTHAEDMSVSLLTTG